MKKSLLSIVVVLALVIGIIPSSVIVKAAGNDSSQTGEYGSFIDGTHVLNDMINKNGTKTHPRIIMTNEKFAKLRSHIGDGSVTANLLEELRGEADRHVRQDPVVTYDAYGEDYLLETSKRVQRRVAALALAYNIFGDEKYAIRCYQELEAACNFPDWSPRHFLDTAEMCTAFAYGYDWLYNWMTPEQRTLLRTNMIEKGLNQVMEDYKDSPSDRNRTYKWYQDKEGDNWQLVCTGGTDLVALAIGDEADAKNISAEVLNYGFKRAYSFVRRAYSNPDGTYIEGLGYWDYATYYLGLQSSALISATGTDYGLADYEGVRKSVDFVRYMSSNVPYSFSFGDDNDSRDTGWAVFLWLGEQFNSPEISAIRLRKIDEDKEFRYLDVLWIDESKQTGTEINNDTDWGSVGACNASFRDTWDKRGLVAALHAGENNYLYHGHYDLGSFYIESNGARFFTDLGNENYNLKNREKSYRIKAEGHNTLVINPTEEIDQRNGANCLVTEFNSGNEAYAVTDLTDAYETSGAKSVVRGLKMIKDKKCVVIQDDISLDSPGDIYWFAHTKGTINVADDGRSAIVTVGSERLWVGIISDGGKLTAMKAEPLPSSLNVSGATNNDAYRKLAIHLSNTKNTTISVVCIPLENGESKPAWMPIMKSISEWSSNGNQEDSNKQEDSKPDESEKQEGVNKEDSNKQEDSKPDESEKQEGANQEDSNKQEDSKPDESEKQEDANKEDSNKQEEIKSDELEKQDDNKPEVTDKQEDPKQDNQNQKLPKQGEEFTDSQTKAKYRVTNTDSSKAEVTYTGNADNNATSIVVPETVVVNNTTYQVTRIADNAFKGNNKVAKITIGANVTSIGVSAFEGCTKLKTVTVNDRLTIIGKKAFYKCKSLTKIIIPASVTKIGKSAFEGCKKLKKVTIKTSKLTTKKIGSKAFKGLHAKAKVKVPKKKLKVYKKLLKKKGLSGKKQKFCIRNAGLH